MDCTASGTATLGQYDNTATVVGTDPAGTQLSDTDPSHYFGVVSGIDVKKYTNGEDADTPPGPEIAPGAPVTWTYVVSNTGNIPITQVALVDDAGVVPSLESGDTNGDGQLDPTETWTYSATGVATSGQYQNTATASGLDTLEDPVSSSDPSHYFGLPRGTPGAQAARAVAAGPGWREPARHHGGQARRALAGAGGNHGAVHAAGAQRGTVTAHRVRVCDQLPSGLAYASARGARISGRNACFTAGTMKRHQTRTFAVSTKRRCHLAPAADLQHRGPHRKRPRRPASPRLRARPPGPDTQAAGRGHRVSPAGAARQSRSPSCSWRQRSRLLDPPRRPRPNRTSADPRAPRPGSPESSRPCAATPTPEAHT